MKQITYSDKQKLVLEVLEQVEKEFKPKPNSYEFERTEYFKKINRIKDYYGIKEKYQTLREFIKSHECGAYHRFHFTIKNVLDVKVTGISEYEQYFNPKFLDEYYVLNDQASSRGNNCENYQCDHYLELVEKED